MEDQGYILELRNISKSFPGVKALDNVSFAVKPGKVHALMGENGAGKSTLMKCAFGIYQPDEGEILINGNPVVFSGPSNALQNGIKRKQDRLDMLFGDSVLLRMHRAIDQRRQAADELHTAMQRSTERLMQTKVHALERERERLRAYSPQQTLKRGFALIAKNSAVASHADDLHKGDAIAIRFYDGTVDALVTGKETI